MKKRLLALFLTLSLLLTLLAGCADPQPDPPTPDAPNNEQPGDNNANDEQNQQPPEAIKHEISVQTLADYTVIVEANNPDQNELAEKFCEEMEKRVGQKPAIATDASLKDGKEIVIGTAGRAEVAATLDSRHDTDAVIRCLDDSILLVSKNADKMEELFELFFNTYYNATDKTISITAGDSKVISEYSLPKDLKLNGVALANYKIVFPKGCDDIVQSTANALRDYFKYNANILLTVTSDTSKDTPYEILIGATSRPESAHVKTLSFGNAQYAMYQVGTKVVCQGKGYYVGSAVHELISNYFPDTGITDPINVTNLPTTCEVKNFVFPEATSVIMMIGDGMGKNHIDMALKAGSLDHFYAYDLPFQTYCQTYSTSTVTDSAASATALATGYKTHNGYIGKNSSGTNVRNVSEIAAAKGANVAVLTTDSLAGATPSGFNVHTISRNNTEDIMAQFEKKLENGTLMYAKGSEDSIRERLAYNTREALGLISQDNSRFFIMIEEAYTDKGSHSNDAGVSNAAVARFNDAIAYAIAFVMLHPDTALLITADHETGGIQIDSNGNFYYTTGSHTAADVPYFALGGQNVADFIATAPVLNNVWNAMFIASVYGMDNFGDPNYRYNK